MTEKISKQEAGRLGGIATKETIRKQVEQRVSNYNLNPKICMKCKTPIQYSKKANKFCSQSCSATFNNKNKRNYNPNECWHTIICSYYFFLMKNIMLLRLSNCLKSDIASTS
jgi:predicted nucleic acid-binding Zn ribbon protein